MPNVKATELQELFAVSTNTLKNSYSPYSKFKVGAAVLASSGKIYGGTNIENASFGLTNCAERTALFGAIAAGERKFKALAIVFSQKGLGKLSTPCGACRQVMAEFCSPDMPIYTADVSSGKPEKVVHKKLKDYYPYPFSPEALQKKPRRTK